MLGNSLDEAFRIYDEIIKSSLSLVAGQVDDLAVNKSSDTDEDDPSHGTRISNFNPNEWVVEVERPPNWAELEKLNQTATAIATSINNQFPDQLRDLYYNGINERNEYGGSIIDEDFRRYLASLPDDGKK